MSDTPVLQLSTSETPNGSKKASYVGAEDTGKGDKVSCKQDGNTLTSSSPPRRKKKSKANRMNKGSQVLYSSLPRQYVGARSGIVTHVSCTVDSAQIAMSQEEDLQNSSDSYSCIEWLAIRNFKVTTKSQNTRQFGQTEACWVVEYQSCGPTTVGTKVRLRNTILSRGSTVYCMTTGKRSGTRCAVKPFT